MMLRQFLYLDQRLTRELLSQAEGGVFSKRHETAESQRSGKAGGKAGIGSLGLEAGGEARSSDRSDRVVEQTDASEFERLHEYLFKHDMLKEIAELDEDSWANLKRGQFVEIEAEISLSAMGTIRKLMDTASAWAPWAEALGSGFDPDTKTTLDQLQELGLGAPGPWLPVVVALGDGPFRFRARLDRKYLRYADEELSGEAIVLGKIGRKLERGQTLQLEELVPGMDLMKGSERKKLERSFKSTPNLGTRIGDLSLSYPAADLVPVAVFR